MATYPNSVLNARADATVDLVDAGTTNANGRCLVYTTGFATLLIQFELQDPAYSAASGSGAATLQGTPISATAAAGGTAADYRVVDRDNNTVWENSGGVTATGGGGELQISNTTIVSGNTYQLASLTHNETQGA